MKETFITLLSPAAREKRKCWGIGSAETLMENRASPDIADSHQRALGVMVSGPLLSFGSQGS